jgi:hypothetical protein
MGYPFNFGRSAGRSRSDPGIPWIFNAKPSGNRANDARTGRGISALSPSWEKSHQIQASPSNVHWLKSMGLPHASQRWVLSNSSEKISFS